uniref:Uncharacterized protein n=1 Tax=Sphaerodactylus townsendi TaxID=933632 RepID=A0ACB8F080_9SAUR
MCQLLVPKYIFIIDRETILPLQIKGTLIPSDRPSHKPARRAWISAAEASFISEELQLHPKSQTPVGHVRAYRSDPTAMGSRITDLDYVLFPPEDPLDPEKILWTMPPVDAGLWTASKDRDKDKIAPFFHKGRL